MARRLFNGRAFSEDGWPYVDEGSCTWTVPPGTSVHLQIQNGPPLAIMRAVAADFNAFVEPLRDPDSACWTPGNSVATSNHPGGTAMDLNWNTHKFQASGTFNAAQQATIKEVVDFYEGMIGWAGPGYWRGGPVDEMHWQMGYGTYDQAADRPVPKVFDFIARKIRADGYSTFRRGNTAQPPNAGDSVDVLMRATGVTQAKAQQIIVGVVNGLWDSQCDNVNRIAMWLAQIGHESAGFNATEEYESGDEATDRWKYKGRTWIQITWRANYAGLSKWAFGKGLIPTPTYFVDEPKKLAEIQYAGLGPAWYWTVARPSINGLCDQRNLVAVTQAINGGQNGAADRKARYDRALALGDQLLALISPTTQGDDDMAQVPQDQWDRVYQELTKKFVSRSPLRHVGEGPLDTMAGFLLNVDGNQHVELVTRLASYNDPDAIALLNEVASLDVNTYPERRHDKQLAQKILFNLSNSTVQATTTRVAEPVAPQVIYQQIAAPVAGGSTGQLIGNAYDAARALLASPEMDDDEKNAAAALIAVLQTKTGAPTP